MVRRRGGQALHEARSEGDSDFGRAILPRLCATRQIYAYDFADNRVPGVQEHEERAYWRDVGTWQDEAGAAVTSWRASSRDRRTDERLHPS